MRNIVSKTALFIIMVILVAGSFIVTPGFADDESKHQQEREEIKQMASKTLNELYALEPQARGEIKNAAGYAVFSNFGMKILLFGSGKGKGIAVNNKSGNEIFMKMLELQAGLGMGVKKFKVIFIFENQSVFDHFITSGWEFGGQATAAAQASGEGASMAGAMSVSPGVWMYQITDDGLALELTAKGTKYMRNDDLN